MNTTFDLIRSVSKPADTKIVLLVMDGLGGLPVKADGPTELESASTPNLDALVSHSICGLHQPIGTGITAGSGPGHLALFGYNPVHFKVGRGVLSALGNDFELTKRDVAARGNFCTVDEAGRVTDRRAGRISTEKNLDLCERLRQIKLSDVEMFVQTEKEHRFLLVLRGEHLSSEITETDPQETGVEPVSPQPLCESREARTTADLVQQFVSQARERLRGERPANMVLLRGFDSLPDWPAFADVFGLRPVALADYPMYRGVAKLVGMKPLETGGSIDAKLDRARELWHDFDFFFIHHKPTDIAGEDGDFNGKVQYIEQIDLALPRLLDMRPDVLIVTGDHSTPSALRGHSWHPVPVMLWSQHCRPDGVKRFGERDCIAGGLGPRFPTTDLMPLALAHALRLDKFGA